MPEHPHPALPKGIFPLLETPFDEQGNIDYESLTNLIEEVIQAGAHGVMAPLVASEVHALSMDEREKIIRHAVRMIADRVPFVAGASSESAEECRHFASLAEQAGASAYLVAVPPALYGRSDGEIVDFFQSITSASTAPIIIQDLQWNGPGLGLETIKRLKESLATLAGMKIETVPAGSKYSLVRKAMGEEFYISGGWAIPQLIEALDRGVDAMVPESSLIRVLVAIYRSHASGRREEAVSLFRKLLPVLVFSNQELFHSIAFFKRFLARRGILKCSMMRSPGYVWDQYNARIADELIDYYLDLEASLAA